MRNNILVLALVAALLGTGVMVTSCNDPVELSSATDAAVFQRGVFSNSRASGSTPAVVANARGSAIPLQVQLNKTPLASFQRDAGLAFATGAPMAAVTGTVIAPSAVLHPVSMATAGTVPLTIPSAGRITCFWNTGSQGVTVADTGNQVLAGNFTLGQYDVLCGISDGTRFIEITRTNN